MRPRAEAGRRRRRPRDESGFRDSNLACLSSLSKRSVVAHGLDATGGKELHKGVSEGHEAYVRLDISPTRRGVETTRPCRSEAETESEGGARSGVGFENPLLDEAAIGARMELGDGASELLFQWIHPVTRHAVIDLFRVAVHGGAAPRAIDSLSCHGRVPQFIVTFSRPYRRTVAIQMSSLKNFSNRLTYAVSTRFAAASKAFWTLEKFPSQKIVTRPSSRITASRFWMTRVPPKGPAETPQMPTALWMYSFRFVSRTCFRIPG